MRYVYIDPEFRSAVEAMGLRDSADWMRYGVETVAFDRTTETRRLAMPAPLPPAYGKIYRYPLPRDRYRILMRGGLLGRSRARVECDNLRLLHSRGLAPRVIAHGRRCRRLVLQESLLVVEAVPGSSPLDSWIPARIPALGAPCRRRFVEDLADFTRAMNADGFVNSEFHWRNILVGEQSGAFRFQAIDPSGSRPAYRFLRPTFDIASLDVAAPWFFSRSERLRFFKRVLGLPGERLSGSSRRLLRKTLALRDRIARKEMKRCLPFLPSPPGSL